MEYHSRTKAKKPKADPKSISSSRTLASQSGDRKRKREGGENGDHQRKGGSRMQQQEAGRAANVEDKRKTGRDGGRAGDVEDKRKAGREGGRAGDAESSPTSSARRGGPATSPKVLLRAEATATTTTHSSPFASSRGRESPGYPDRQRPLCQAWPVLVL